MTPATTPHEAPSATAGLEIKLSAQATGFLFLPTPSASIRASVLMAGAMGVPARFYRHFARYLAQHNFAVLTLEYSGTRDKTALLDRDRNSTIVDWAEQDLARALDYLAEHFPGLPLLHIGHSLGGQLLGLIPNNHLIDASLLVASGFGYWRLFPKRHWPKMLLAWYVLVPLFTATFGYLPGWVIGGGALPASIAKQWRRWCLNPDYMCDEDAKPLRPWFHVPKRIVSVSFTDDFGLTSQAAAEALLEAFTTAETRSLRITPTELGLAAIGHFGAFRRHAAAPLWPQLLTLLERLAEGDMLATPMEHQSRDLPG